MSKTAAQIIAGVDNSLSRWRLWYPDEESIVEIPRCHLITLIEAARIGVAASNRLAECPRCCHPKPISEVVLLEKWECPRCGRVNRFPISPAIRSPSSAPAAPTAPGSVTPTES